MVTDRPSPVERARKLQPLVREYADQAERERRLPAPVAEALAREGLYRMAAPSLLNRGSRARRAGLCASRPQKLFPHRVQPGVSSAPSKG